jgi:hypothetical protein
MSQFPGGRDRPPRSAGERETLLALLDFHRATLTWKLEGLEAELARPAVTPSGLGLLGLVKHETYVERWWFEWVFAGRDVDFPWTDEDPDADFRVEADDTYEGIVAGYGAQVARSREIVADASLDDLARRASEPTTLRWIVLHMIQETARHNGHADIVRETLDGATGE